MRGTSSESSKNELRGKKLNWKKIYFYKGKSTNKLAENMEMEPGICFGREWSKKCRGQKLTFLRIKKNQVIYLFLGIDEENRIKFS